MQTLRIKDLDGRTLAETQPVGWGIGTHWAWAVSAAMEQFECDADDVSEIETDDGELLMTVCGEPVGQLVHDFGVRA